MSSPALTVIMPTYNRERLVGRAIDSILSQTFTDFEFVIVDDGSTDNSREVLDRYAEADHRIRLFYIEHAGPAGALNYGLRMASAPLVAIMDSDDASFPRRLEIEYEIMERNREIAVVTGSNIFNENGVKQYVYYYPARHRVIRESFFCNRKFFTHVSTMMRKDIILKAGGYRKEFPTGFDLDLWLTLLLGGHRLETIPNIVGMVYCHPQSITQENWRINVLSYALIFLSYYLRKDGMPDCIRDDTIIGPTVVKTASYKYRKIYELVLFHTVLMIWRKISDYKDLMYRKVGLFDIVILYIRSFLWTPVLFLKKSVRRFLHLLMMG